MVRSYKRKTDRGSYGPDTLSDALKALGDGMPLIQASKQYGVPARTLRRHRDKKVRKPGAIQLGRYQNAIPEIVENELKEHVVNMEKRMFGLQTRDVQRLAFDVAVKSGIKHPFNKTKRIAGKDWVQGFLSRHHLTIRQPQATSLARAVGFNKPKVTEFFDLYKTCLETKRYQPSKIWNMDETGVTTVQKPGKIMASKGTRQVGKLTSAERGTLITMICACSAAGSFLPPFYIFPRKRMVETLMKDAPPQSVGHCSASGWTDSELFVLWLRHFVAFTNCSERNPHLIMLDGHHSHKSLEAIEFCRSNGIELITFPPHSTHKMQPLDRTYFKSFKAAFNLEADNWMVTHAGKRITVYEMAGLTGKAFVRTALAEKAIKGFKTCGLWPFDPNVFTDTDFDGAKVTEEDITDLINDNRRGVVGVGTMGGGGGVVVEGTVGVGGGGVVVQGSVGGGVVVEGTMGGGVVVQGSVGGGVVVEGTMGGGGGGGGGGVVIEGNMGGGVVVEGNMGGGGVVVEGNMGGGGVVVEGTVDCGGGGVVVEGNMGGGGGVVVEGNMGGGGGVVVEGNRPRDVWVQCQICKLWAHEVCTPGTAQFICPNCESDYSDTD